MKAEEQQAVNEDGRAELDALKHDVQALRSDLKQLLRSVSQDSRNRLGEVAMKLEGMTRRWTSQAQDKMHDVVDAAREHGYQAARMARKGVQHRPFATTVAAFLGGLIVGRLFMRR
jgi:ElaB/YqjD/DUF883 family membrane-anchored ribosome-binding protein